MMCWKVEYFPPPTLLKLTSQSLSNKPIAAVHDMIRHVINNSNQPENTVRSITDRVLMELLNSPIFSDCKKAIMKEDEGEEGLRSQIRKIVYNNVSLEKIPWKRRTIKDRKLIPISKESEWSIILDSKTMDTLVTEFGQDGVKAIEHNFLDLRIVKTSIPVDDENTEDPLLDRLHSNSSIDFSEGAHNILSSIWDENEIYSATYYSDRVRHYCPKYAREQGWKIEDRVNRENSFEQSDPIDGWKTTKALLIPDPIGRTSYGLCYNPSVLESSHRTKGWSLTKWNWGGSQSMQEPEIRHIGIVNGQQVKDSSFVYDLMRIFRSCVWRIDLASAFSDGFLSQYDLPYLKDDPTVTQTYWVEVAKAIHDEFDRNGGLCLGTKILNSCGWRTTG